MKNFLQKDYIFFPVLIFVMAFTAASITLVIQSCIDRLNETDSAGLYEAEITRVFEEEVYSLGNECPDSINYITEVVLTDTREIVQYACVYLGEPGDIVTVYRP